MTRAEWRKVQLPVGTQIVGCRESCGVDLTGRTGEIICVDSTPGSYGVRFDEPCDFFHSLGGRCKNRHGFWVESEDIRTIESMWELNLENGFESLFE